MVQAHQDIMLWGHSLRAYTRMFGLTVRDLNLSVLDCWGGPASFNAELTAMGGKVVSIDPIFALPENELKTHIEIEFKEMLAKVEQHQDRFVWESYASPEDLANRRKRIISIFLKDFSQGKVEGRYQGIAPLKLPFSPFQFDLALVSHFLFANSPEQTVEYHLAVINDLCRVAKEIRIFPLLNSMGEIPELVGPVTQALHQQNFGVEIKAVSYEFQKKGNAMLRVWPQTCEL